MRLFPLLGLALAARISAVIASRIVNIADIGAKPNDAALATCQLNTRVINKALALLQPGDTMLVPNATFHVAGGITGGNLTDITLQIDGTLKWDNNQTAWPRAPGGRVHECFYLETVDNLTITSSGTGIFDGSGEAWWGYLNYLLIGENRPRLLHIEDGADILVENLLLKQSPYWTFFAHDVNGIEVRHSAVEVHYDNATDHDWLDISAFNTDGFDIAGANVYVHDVTVWNDDDCVCVKGLDGTGKRAQCSENWLVERVSASGVGLTIGSIGPSEHHTCVNNITFRDAYMFNTFKGIYMKSRPGSGSNTETASISNILYENITIHNATQWSFWLGPQQASYEGACSLFWPFLPSADCPVPPQVTWENVTLRDIRIQGGVISPGVILGNTSNPMRNIVFDNVVASDPGSNPFGDAGYSCAGVENAVATGDTSPVPPCFDHQ